MISLKHKYFLLNGFCAAVSIGAIALLFYVCNRGFADLASISAKNLSALYTSGELKSLLWKEMLDLEMHLQKRKPREAFDRSAQQVSDLARTLEKNAPEDHRAPITDLIEIHDRLLGYASESPRTKGDAELGQSAKILYLEGYHKLNEFAEAVLLGSQEEQSRRIRETNQIMQLALLGAIGFTFVILSLSFLYFRVRFINPIMKISSASLKAADGAYNPIRMETPNDEIGILVKNFNYMMGEIREASSVIRSERDNAEKANQAKSVFLANMSHELRTPMHGILSFARFGQTKIETAPKEKLKSYFDEIHDSGAKLMMLLNDILDLSKLEAGKIEYSVQAADLSETVGSVISEMKAFVEENGLHIEVASKGTATPGFFDAPRIMQVARNLLTNAVKFSEAGSVVRVELEYLSDRLRCAVINRGIGIPRSELESVFDKFIQSSKTRTGAGGTGLGLAICKEIIQQHGGRIWAESEEGIETRFIFELPGKQAAHETLQQGSINKTK
jgi:signal transduction histidine kinase